VNSCSSSHRDHHGGYVCCCDASSWKLDKDGKNVDFIVTKDPKSLSIEDSLCR
jgi:hypothetical protein